MSNKARKERKRAGVPFEKEPKVGTPIALRALRPSQVFTRATSAKHAKKNADTIRFLKSFEEETQDA